jgi:hypothetical protein
MYGSPPGISFSSGLNVTNSNCGSVDVISIVVGSTVVVVVAVENQQKNVFLFYSCIHNKV